MLIVCGQRENSVLSSLMEESFEDSTSSPIVR